MESVNPTQQFYLAPPELPYLELRATHNSTQAYKAHRHDSVSIGAIITGATRLSCHKQTQTLNTGELVVIEPDCVHSCNPLPNQARSYYMLFLDPLWLAQTISPLYGDLSPGFHIPAHKIKHPDLFRQYNQFVDLLRQRHFAQAEAILTHFLLCLFTLYIPKPAHNRPHQITQSMKQIFTENLETPPKLKELAGQFQLRPETLIRQFKKHTGTSPKAYLNSLRIEHAKQLLKNGNAITEVSYQLGFADQSHFQKTFSHYTALTPRQYQQNRSIFDKI